MSRHERQLPYMMELDSLRAFAAISVVVHHNIWRDPDLALTAAVERLHLGRVGVRLFYVLSGFLITGILLRCRDRAASKGKAWKSFYIRRFLRIFPLYYLCIGLLVWLGNPLVTDYLGWHVTYLSNLLFAVEDSFPGPPVSHFWSLAVEEQFYLVWPFVVLFTPDNVLPKVLVAMLALGPASRLVVFLATGSEVAAQVIPTSCLDTLSAGALLAWFWHVGQRDRVSQSSFFQLLPLLGGLAFVALPLINLWAPIFEVVLIDTAVMCVFVWMVHHCARGIPGRFGKLMRLRPVVYLGSISYGIYLWHHIIPTLIKPTSNYFDIWLRFPHEFGLARVAYVTAATVALSIASFHLFESPINELKNRFPYYDKTKPPRG